MCEDFKKGDIIMKRILALLLALTLSTMLCACGKPEPSPIEDFEYEFEDGTAIITGYFGSDLEIVIPDMIEDRPVTAIGKDAFELYDLTSIIIPEGVKNIEMQAFHNCECLEDITVPSTLEFVSADAFWGTPWYDNQPDGVLYIDDVAIGYKGEFSDEIYIEKGTKTIVGPALICEGNYSRDGEELTTFGEYNSVHIPDSVSYIGYHAVGYARYYFSEFNNTNSSPITGFTVYGKSGSVAETYANENGFTFIAE